MRRWPCAVGNSAKLPAAAIAVKQCLVASKLCIASWTASVWNARWLSVGVVSMLEPQEFILVFDWFAVDCHGLISFLRSFLPILKNGYQMMEVATASRVSITFVFSTISPKGNQPNTFRILILMILPLGFQSRLKELLIQQ